MYLYAAVDDARVAGANAGPDLKVIGRGSVALVARPGPEPLPEPSPAALRDHDAIVRRLMGACAVAPFRFGSAVESEAAAESWLDGAREGLAARLPALRGRVEVAVRAWCRPARSAPPPDPEGGQPGRRYLAGLAAQRGPGSLHQLHQSLASQSVGAEARAWGPHGIKASYLVDSESAPGFVDRVRQFGRADPGLTRVWVTGPWAPYSFTAPMSPPVTAPGAVDAGAVDAGAVDG